jgi:hypothetical protein
MIERRRLIALAGTAPVLMAADALSDAQVLLFETPHLAALQPPLRLDYAFLREEAGRDPVRDSIRLEVRASAEAGRRDVTTEFLTGPRAIHYPPAPGFRGNPLLLFALDRDARELSAATGGSTAWFRNRIRQGLAEAATLHRITVETEGRHVEATEIDLMPFAGEPRARRYQERRYSFVVTDAVPGWVQAIRTDLPASEGAGAVRESIVFVAAVPQPEATR